MSKAVKWGDWLFTHRYNNHVDIIDTMVNDGVLTYEDVQAAVDANVLDFGWVDPATGLFSIALRNYYSRVNREGLIGW